MLRISDFQPDIMTPTKEIIKKVVDEIDADELITLTADLVRINSVWDPQAGTSEQAVAERIADWAQTQGFDIQVDQVAPNRPNIIISSPAGSRTRTLPFQKRNGRPLLPLRRHAGLDLAGKR